jgi:hypothetical protein
MTSYDPDAVLSPSSGAPALKFTEVGTTHKGRIVAKEARQQTDYTTGDAKFWPNGDPMLEVVITLDVGGEEGRLFARGQMLNAVRQAIREAGATTLEPGGTLAVQFTHEEPNKNPRFNPIKMFRAQYQPPAKVAVAAADDLLAAAPTASDLL